MATRIKDVARLAGVSSATVSRVLSRKPHVRPEVKERVLEAVNELSYEPNRVARSLRVQRSSIIGLVISDIQNSFFNTIVRAIEDVAYQHGYAVFLCNTDEDPEKEAFYLNLLKAERVAGIIFTPARETNKACQAVIASGIPVIAIDRKLTDSHLDTVLTDNKEASQQLVEYLIHKGHKKIAGIFPNLETTTGRERLEGYQNALEKHSLPLQENLIFSGQPVEEDGYQLTKGILEQTQIDALFVATKLMTIGALRAILEQDLKIPEDIELAAFDKLDWMPFIPALAYAEQPTYTLGKTAAQLLLDRIAVPKKDVQQLTLESSIILPKMQYKNQKEAVL